MTRRGDSPIRLLVTGTAGVGGVLESAAVSANRAVGDGGTVVLFQAGCGRVRPATVVSTGMIYAALKPIRQWHDPLVVPVYLLFALATGAVVNWPS